MTDGLRKEHMEIVCNWNPTMRHIHPPWFSCGFCKYLEGRRAAVWKEKKTGPVDMKRARVDAAINDVYFEIYLTE